MDYLSGHNAAPAGGTIYLGAGEYDLTAAAPAHVRLDGSQWQTPPAALNLVGMGGTIGGGQAATRLVSNIHVNFLHDWGVSNFQMKGVLNASENSGTAVVSGWTNTDTPDTGLVISEQTGSVTLRDVHISHCTESGRTWAQTAAWKSSTAASQGITALGCKWLMPRKFLCMGSARYPTTATG